MADKEPAVSEGQPLDQDLTYTLEEISVTCRVEPDWIAALVEEGAVEAVGAGRSEWAFRATTIVRIAKARRLERDFSLGTQGLALALDLLDEIEGLKARLRKHGLE